MAQRGKCSLYRRPRKGFSLRVGPHFHLIQNHWSCIWVSIIQQEHRIPLWEGSRYWTLHYLLDRGIAGRQYIPPERLFWDQAPAAPLMTPSISRGPPATQIQRFYNLYTSAFVISLLQRPPWPTLLDRWQANIRPPATQWGLTLHNLTVVPGAHALQWLVIVLLKHTSHLSL